MSDRRPGGGIVTVALCGAFVLSGAAALLFETLWFRLAGLALGNSVLASSAVLASFMAGLAVGNAVAAGRGEQVRRPLRAYAALEVATAVLGAGLVLVFPALTARLGPALGPLADRPWLLEAARGGVAFALMLLPAAAMGATLPLAARALASSTGAFSVSLGRLYGWNTIGGVLGALLGEAWLVPALGLSRTAALAAALNVLAGLAALVLDARPAPVGGAGEVLGPKSAPAPRGARRASARLASLLAAALLCGGTLLALEVVWFRLLLLFVFGTQLAFAVMLATVLAGIGAGGLAGAAWQRRRPRAPDHAALLAVAAGACTLLTYAAFDPALVPSQDPPLVRALLLSLRLMFPTAFLSGLLFALLGTAVRDEVRGDTAAAGWLTLANTLGAAAGAPLAGLALVPWLGVERSLFAFALVYGLAAAALLPWVAGRRRLGVLAAAAGFATLAALFPFGLMRGRFIRHVIAARHAEDSRLVAVREGVTETALLVQDEWGGLPVYQRLFTNAHSMTSTTFYGRRYMKLFAHLALALRPQSRRALLISYGLGNTAEALLRAPGLERLDVVDISRSILGLSPQVTRDGVGDPLADPRVRVRVEDGRFHLLSTGERYDVITAEPPPPRAAGVVSLYTREYFGLVRRRLVEGGVATHWLPVNQLSAVEAKAITAAFCRAFEDCSLWTGADRDWILLGTNGAGPPGEGGLARRWREPSTAADLEGIGVETPAQLGSLFVGDRAFLDEWTGNVPPLEDDRPGGLDWRDPPAADQAEFLRVMSASASARRFAASAFVARLWPKALLAPTAEEFARRDVFDRHLQDPTQARTAADLWAVLDGTSLRTLPLVLLGSEPRMRETARLRWAQGERHPAVAYHAAVAALADRDYATAARLFVGADPGRRNPASPALLAGLSLALGGRRDEARVAIEAAGPFEERSAAAAWREWLLGRVGRPGDAP